ncbi:MAG: ribonuclease Y [Ruminococcaceae bacterium]|nr:ribonuclease Y [Oscillospiraceae bacterium]MBQ8898442.1 ribonuclease Y [Clostridia bacterium]
MDWLHYVLIAACVVAAAVFFFVGLIYRKRIAEKEIGSAEEEARRILNEAIKNAEAKKREALVEAKEEIIRNKNEADKEIRERRNEIQRTERRLQQKDETLDRKLDNIDAKEETLNRKIKEAEAHVAEAQKVKAEQLEMLERISGFTVEEAKAHILREVEGDARHDVAVKLREIEQDLKEDSERKAKEILSLAIQKCSAEYVAEATVSVVPLPNDEMKGRIIGREGRNIRAIETATGVDLIIDDTPEAITLSCFDPVRREVARQALERLISDGRIHPARIEEMVEKARRDVDATIKSEGEKAVFELGLHGVPGELIKILGRLRFRTSYGQNVLRHSLEVAHLAGYIAGELGADVNMAKRAGLFHDIGKAMDHEVEGSHVTIGVDIAKRFKENPEVIHAIEAHHGDVEPHSIIAFIVDAADDISAARPGARRENLEAYIRRLERLEEISNSFPGVDKSFAIQAGREIRIMVKPDMIDDDGMVILARDLSKKIENDLEYPGQIKICLIRETRAVDYAK